MLVHRATGLGVGREITAEITVDTVLVDTVLVVARAVVDDALLRACC